MIAKHSREQSGSGEGVAVIKNEPCHHPLHGAGQFTEKRIYLSRYNEASDTQHLNYKYPLRVE